MTATKMVKLMPMLSDVALVVMMLILLLPTDKQENIGDGVLKKGAT